MNLYMKNRALNIYHIWCNPSAEQLDRFFIKEKIKGIFFCASKDSIMRPYYFIPRQKMLKILDKYKSLGEDVIRRVVKEYALYKGWFRDYHGKIREEYKSKKLEVTKDVSEEFVNKWSKQNQDNTTEYTTNQVRKALSASWETVMNYRKSLEEGVHYFRNDWGRYRYYPEGIEKMKQIQKENQEKWRKNLEKGRLPHEKRKSL